MLLVIFFVFLCVCFYVSPSRIVGKAKTVGAYLAAHRTKGERTNAGALELWGLVAGSVGKVVKRSLKYFDEEGPEGMDR